MWRACQTKPLTVRSPWGVRIGDETHLDVCFRNSSLVKRKSWTRGGKEIWHRKGGLIWTKLFCYFCNSRVVLFAQTNSLPNILSLLDLDKWWWCSILWGIFHETKSPRWIIRIYWKLFKPFLYMHLSMSGWHANENFYSKSRELNYGLHKEQIHPQKSHGGHECADLFI